MTDAAAHAAEQLGAGETVSFGSAGEVSGRVSVLREVGDAIGLLSLTPEELAETIVWINEPVVTIVAPIMEQVAAILCSTGGPASHVAIVARELGLPCLMRCTVAAEDELSGREVIVRADGTIWAGKVAS
jgi:phosphoenolpyruvate synthase/pyruvate phosphate dikinase